MTTSRVSQAVIAFIDSATIEAPANDNVVASDVDAALARTLAERRYGEGRERRRWPR